MKIEPGVYENLISRAIAEKLKEYSDDRFLITKEDIDSGDVHNMLAGYLGKIVSNILEEHFNKRDEKQKISSQIAVVNRILQFIEDEWNAKEMVVTAPDMISNQSHFLRGIYSKVGYNEEQIKEMSKCHPLSGYRMSSLFTGGSELTMEEELRRDIQTADQVDLVVSFIKFEGLRLLYPTLKSFVSRPGTHLRILTTTYMGATDPKAIRRLRRLGELGDVEIKASFNTNQERLHAKAYIFKRTNGLDTAYIGSSNMSRSALTKGLEWNIRVTSMENAHIIAKTQATFDNYWNSEDFEPIATDQDLERFEEAIRQKRGDECTPEVGQIVRFERKTHQVKVLEKLQYERQMVKSYKNLVIAATGTGKTVMCAFDFKDFDAQTLKVKGRHARLLFVVHREKILKQALFTFRSVMVDREFGALWTGNIKPSAAAGLGHLFITVQTLIRHWADFERLGEDYYDYIVIDEVHHSKAGSYTEIFQRFNPTILMGLTATPERMDGKEIKPDFNNRFAAEIRLHEALNQQLLAPFDYFCVTDDSVDLSRLVCHGDRYDTAELAAKYVGNTRRIEIIQQALNDYITDPMRCKAVCFCSGITHAQYMAQQLSLLGYKAMAVTSKNSSELDHAADLLAKGALQYLCVADMLNEGIDIPEIDTVLFLRPTESLTIFLQQLGRGLRLADGKTCLTVLDFVAQANKSYNYESRLRALKGPGGGKIADDVKNGFTMLPRGCSITMEHQAQEYILRNINEAVFNLPRLRREVAAFERTTGKEFTLANFLDNFSLDWRLLSKSPGSWARLLVESGQKVDAFDIHSRYTRLLEAGLSRLYHINSYEQLAYLLRLIDNGMHQLENATPREQKFLQMFYATIWFDYLEKINSNKDYAVAFQSEEEAVASLAAMPWFMSEMRYIVTARQQQLSKTTEWMDLGNGIEMELYGCYSADEIHLMIDGKMGHWNVAGTQYCYDHKIAMVFVTLNKTDKEYTPNTLYEDYAISNRQFHWQSMNSVTVKSREGQRIVDQRHNGWRFILFVRDAKRDEYGITNGYYCLGLMDYNSSHSEAPINVVWDMQQPIPGFILEAAKAV